MNSSKIYIQACIAIIMFICSCEEYERNNQLDPEYKYFDQLQPELLAPVQDNTLNTKKISLSWEEIPSAGSYIINIDTIPEIREIYCITRIANENHDTVTLCNNTYYWRVRAKNKDKQSQWSRVWSFTVKCDSSNNTPIYLPILLCPKDSIFISETNISFIFRWLPQTGSVDNYQIIVLKDLSQPVIRNTISDSIVIDSLSPGNYKWFIMAWKNNISKISDTLSFVIAAIKTPTPISPTEGLIVSIDSIPPLCWEQVEYATQYVLYISEYDDFAIFDEYNPTSTCFNNKVFKPGKRYYWKVAASRNNVISEFSDAWYFDIK